MQTKEPAKLAKRFPLGKRFFNGRRPIVLGLPVAFDLRLSTKLTAGFLLQGNLPGIVIRMSILVAVRQKNFGADFKGIRPG